ncbi:MAG: glycosyltransferase [Nitrospinae bacterium]|nr:glycosyltransferase [Nitrospinota bacterium]
MSPGCRVLVLNERVPRHPSAGGAEVHVLEVFRRLVEMGFEITHAASSFRGSASEERVEGIHVRRLGPLPVYYPRAAWTCARATRAGEFDVVVTRPSLFLYQLSIPGWDHTRRSMVCCSRSLKSSLTFCLQSMVLYPPSSRAWRAVLASSSSFRALRRA